MTAEPSCRGRLSARGRRPTGGQRDRNDGTGGVPGQEVGQFVDDDVVLVDGARLRLVEDEIRSAGGKTGPGDTRILDRLGLEPDRPSPPGGESLAQGTGIDRAAHAQLAQQGAAPAARGHACPRAKSVYPAAEGR